MHEREIDKGNARTVATMFKFRLRTLERLLTERENELKQRQRLPEEGVGCGSPTSRRPSI